MTIIADSRERKWDHVKDFFDREGIKWIRSKLPVGDYGRMDNLSLVIDRKAGLNEVESNLVHQHERFRRECQLAQSNGIRLIVLVESDAVRDLDGVGGWKNPRREYWQRIDRAHAEGKMLNRSIPSRPPLAGSQLKRTMLTMADKYGVEWRFCPQQDAGKTICRILEDLQPR